MAPRGNRDRRRHARGIELSLLKQETEQLQRDLNEANDLNEVKEQLCDFAAGVMKTRDTELKELKKENETLRRRLDIRERSIKQFLASATKEEATAAALETQAQKYLELVKGQQGDIASRDREIADLRWEVEHARKYQKCAEDLQALVDALKVENRQLFANGKYRK